MRHVILTCANHRDLRWSTKEIAVTDGKFNGARSIFFLGTPRYNSDGTPKMYFDGSGLDCARYVEGRGLVEECKCSAKELIVAPEDSLVKVRP